MDDIFGRNIGFVSKEEQARLSSASVLIMGVGGMGGAALECLLRAGVGRFVIADPDHFELHNLNRQVFSDMDGIGKSKVETTKALALKINPGVKIETHERLSGEELRRAIGSADVVINGCDDARASIELHRVASELGRVAIDALAATLPNVCLFPPGSGGVETLFGSPARGIALAGLTPEILAKHAEKEIEFVMIHSSSRKYVDCVALKEFMAGTRKRFSFAPMVLTTGNLMAAEAIAVLLGRGAKTRQVYFLNLWTRQIERPKRGLAKLFGMLAALRFAKSL